MRTQQERAADLERIQLAAHQRGEKLVGTTDMRHAIESVAAAAAEEALQIASEKTQAAFDEHHQELLASMIPPGLHPFLPPGTVPREEPTPGDETR